MPMAPISATLDAKDRAAIMAAVTTIREKLPFLIDLTADDLLSQPQSETQGVTQDGRSESGVCE